MTVRPDHGVRPTHAHLAPRVLSAFFGLFIATVAEANEWSR